MLGLEIISRKDCGLILAGMRVCDSQRQVDWLLTRLERQRLIKRQGRGREARFNITDAGIKQVAIVNPESQWNAPWDGKWRAFVYDLPERRRTERILLWRALRARRFGLLQRSVWVWPHDAEPILRQVVQTSGLPDYFCGFVCEQLFLCSNSQVVNTAWDIEELENHHKDYLKHSAVKIDALTAAPDLQSLAQVVREERAAYEHAFSEDPLLPKELWPKSYKGHLVEKGHQKFRAVLRRQMQEHAV